MLVLIDESGDPGFKLTKGSTQHFVAAMVIFHGEAGYISPNWYPSKLATHRQVPTWN